MRFVSGVLGFRLLCTSNGLLPPGWFGVIRSVLINSARSCANFTVDISPGFGIRIA